MIALAIVVFIALFHVKAGYGYLANGKWGPKINNKLGWVLMESPVFLLMLYMFLDSPRSTFEKENIIYFALSAPFFIHYFQRSFIFPLLIKGHGKMPLTIILMGVIFNTINAYMQGEWLYYLSPADRYTNEWLSDPRFLIGMLIFSAGFYLNLREAIPAGTTATLPVLIGVNGDTRPLMEMTGTPVTVANLAGAGIYALHYNKLTNELYLVNGGYRPTTTAGA